MRTLLCIVLTIVYIDPSFGTSEIVGGSVLKSAINSGVEKLQDLKNKVNPTQLIDKENHHRTIWDKVAHTILNELKTSLPEETCLPRLLVEKTKINEVLKLTKGKLVGFNKINHNNDAALLQDYQDTADVEVQFKFKNLRLEFNYQYEGKSLMSEHKKRVGDLVLQMDGETIFTVVASAKKTAMSTGNMFSLPCYLTIKNAGINKMGNLRIVRVLRGNFFTRPFYFIFKYFSRTVRGVTALVTSVQDELKSYVTDALLDVMETGVKKLKGVCGADKKVKNRDCSTMKVIKNYDP